MRMNVGIVGTGAIALATAAWLTRRGHQISIWSPSGRSTHGLPDKAEVVATGLVEGTFAIGVARDVRAMRLCETIIIAIPANGHRGVMDALAPHLTDAHNVIASAALSLSPLYLALLCAARGVHPLIASFGTTVLTARKTGSVAVSVNTLRTRLDVASIPAERGESAFALCNALFGERFDLASNALATALVNINPVAHAGLALSNVTRIERGEAWPQYHYLTPGVARLIAGLDAERLAIAAGFGLRVRSIEQHFEHSFDLPAAPLADQAAVLHTRRGGPPGPTSLDTRFVLEDVPYGLAFLTAIGRIAEVPTPLIDAAITLLSTLWGRDLARENDLLPQLALDGLDRASLLQLVATGCRNAR